MKSDNPMKSENWIIVELGAALLLLSLVGFFRIPAYGKLVDYVSGAFAAAFATVVGYKFGRSMPQQAGDAKPGQSSKTTTESEITAPAEAAPSNSEIR